MRDFKKILVISIVMLVLDVIWLKFGIGPSFSKMVSNIQGKTTTINYYYAAGAYIFMIISFYQFIVKKNSNYFDSYLLGIIIFAVFDLTSAALFDDWKLELLVLDIMWGGLLYLTTHYIYNKIIKKKVKNNYIIIL